MTRQEILTPFDISLSIKEGKLTYWKQILPVSKVNYLGTKLDFSHEYMDDLILAFQEKALDQTPFVLADKDNAHTMDAERFRGEVVDMRKYEDLPPEVAAKLPNGNGLYGKIEFPDRESAQAVMRNPKLGVSARIREAVERIDGKKWKRAVIHVLGTLDPRATGMQPWLAVDLSNDGDTVVLDFSRATYPERNSADMTVTRNKSKKVSKAPIDLSTIAVEDVTAEDIDAMTDDQVSEYLARLDINEDDLEALAAIAEDGEDDEDDDSDEDDSDDEEDDDGDDPDGDDENEGDTALSNYGGNDIALANAAAAHATSVANAALKRASAAEWRDERSQLVRAGVPPFLLDLAEPVLSRPSAMVVDLSNTDDDDVNVSQILRDILEGTKGFVDMSNEAGHNGQTGSAAPSDEEDKLLAAWTV